MKTMMNEFRLVIAEWIMFALLSIFPTDARETKEYVMFVRGYAARRQIENERYNTRAGYPR